MIPIAIRPDAIRLDAIRAEHWLAQFRELDLKDPASWPPVPRVVLSMATGLAVYACGWLLWLDGELQTLRALRAENEMLRASFSTKAAQAANLDLLRAQKDDVTRRVVAAERQLPGKTEMEALLADINRAGLTRGLHFDLFKPASARIATGFAEIPIQLKVTGRYESLAAFAADLAAMARIVSLRNLQLSLGKGDVMVMEAEAVAYRALDAAEKTGRAGREGLTAASPVPAGDAS